MLEGVAAPETVAVIEVELAETAIEVAFAEALLGVAEVELTETATEVAFAEALLEVAEVVLLEEPTKQLVHCEVHASESAIPLERQVSWMVEHSSLQSALADWQTLSAVPALRQLLYLVEQSVPAVKGTNMSRQLL